MPVIDDFSNYSRQITAPYGDAVEVSPSDSVDLGHVTRGLHIAGSGDLTVTMESGAKVTWRNLQTGHHPIRARRVWDTDTTATGIVAGW